MLGEVPQKYQFSHSKEKMSGSPREFFLERTGDVFTGGLNQNWVYGCVNEKGTDKYVLRVPRSIKERTVTQKSLQQELDGIGATEHGVAFVLRDIPQQARFIDGIRAQGLNTIDYFDVQENAMLFPFFEGVPLHKYIASGHASKTFSVVDGVLNHLTMAHRAGIVFGDRWVTNTLILPNEDFAEVDFDIELIGEHQRIATFELAQTLYHLIHFSGSQHTDAMNMLEIYYRGNPKQLSGYDRNLLSAFLLGHQSYFMDRYRDKNELYEGLIPPGEEVNQFAHVLEDIYGGDNLTAHQKEASFHAQQSSISHAQYLQL